MNRINHILVVVDPTASAPQSAVDKAGLLAQRLGASIELLICDIESPVDDGVVTLHAHKTPASNTQLLDLLDALAAPMRALKTEVTVRTIYGKSLHDSLLDYLRGANADLVVKDTHHHSLAKRTLLRNTDWYLTRGCPVPLLLTKKKAWHRPPVIMAAVDPNQTNERASALDRDILSSAASRRNGYTRGLLDGHGNEISHRRDGDGRLVAWQVAPVGCRKHRSNHPRILVMRYSYRKAFR